MTKQNMRIENKNIKIIKKIIHVLFFLSSLMYTCESNEDLTKRDSLNFDILLQNERSTRSTEGVSFVNTKNLYTENEAASPLMQDAHIYPEFINATSVTVSASSTTNGILTIPTSLTVTLDDSSSYDISISPVFTSDNKEFTVSGLHSNDEYETVLKSFKYSNEEVLPTSILEIIKIFVDDGVNKPIEKNILIILTAVNDRPYFINHTIPTKVIDEDTKIGHYVPPTLSELLFNIIEDADAGDTKGVVVLYADNSHGQWSYFRQGSKWVDIEAVSATDSDGNVLRDENLAPQGGEQVLFLLVSRVVGVEFLRYIPGPDFNGESKIVFLPWDKAELNLAGDDFYDVTWPADSTAFGEQMATFTFQVNPLPDRSVLDLSAVTGGVLLGTFIEDVTAPPVFGLNALLAVCSDADIPFDDSLSNLGIAVTYADQTNGDWFYSTSVGGAYTRMENFAVLLGVNGDATSQRIKFIPNANYFGSPRIRFKCWDLSTGGSGDVGVDTSSDAFSVDEGFAYVTITAVNDAPTFTSTSNIALATYPEAPLLSEAGSTVTSLLTAHFYDADPGTTVGVAVVDASTPTDGEFSYTCDTSSNPTWQTFNGGTYKGYVVNNKPALDIATLLSATCKIRFIPTDAFSFTSPSLSTISVIPWDGTNGITAPSTGVATDSSHTESAYGSTQITIVATYTEPPSRPVLTSASVGTTLTKLTFTENDDPMPVVSDIEIAKLNVATMKSAKITLTNAYDHSSGESLTYDGTDLTKSTSVLIDDANSPILEFTLSGVSSLSDYESALRKVSYTQTSDNPTAGDRAISFVVTDNEGVVSIPLKREISIVSVNDPPVITFDKTTIVLWDKVQFNQDGPAINIYSGVSKFYITDPDDTVPVTMTVQISNVRDSLEKLQVPSSVEITNTVNSNTEIVKTVSPSSTYDITSGILTLQLTGSGTYTMEDYAEMLRQVTYINEANPPTFSDRTVTAKVTDSHEAVSNDVIITIQMIDVDGNYQGDGSGNAKPLSPSITSATAQAATEIVDGKDVHTDAKFYNGDSIKIEFNFATNMAPHGFYDVTTNTADKTLSRAQVDSIFTFSNLLAPSSVADAYTGEWVDAKTFVITMKQTDPANTPKISEWTVSTNSGCDTSSTSNCIRDFSGRSDVSVSTSPPLDGNWGLNVPQTQGIIVDNGAVKVSLLTVSSDFIGDGSKVSFILTPSFTDTELEYFCGLSINTILGDVSSLTYNNLDASVNSCYNTDSEGANNSVVVIILSATGSSTTSFTQETFSNEVQIEFSAVSGTVSQTTGVSQQIFIAYFTGQPTQPSPPVYLTSDNELTPNVTKVTIQRGADTNFTESDVIIHEGDVITLTFNRLTDTPPVDNIADIDKIMTISPSIPNPGYTGKWIDEQTLEITLLADPSTTAVELKISFTNNQFIDLTYIPDDYSQSPECIGINICGTSVTDASVGICDKTMTSCRASGDLTVSFVANKVEEEFVWWWILLLCIIMLVSWIVVAFLARKLCINRSMYKKSRRLNDDVEGSFFRRNASFGSSDLENTRPTTSTSFSESNANRNNVDNNNNNNSSNVTHSTFPLPYTKEILQEVSPSPISLRMSLFASNRISPSNETPIPGQTYTEVNAKENQSGIEIENEQNDKTYSEILPSLNKATLGTTPLNTTSQVVMSSQAVTSSQLMSSSQVSLEDMRASESGVQSKLPPNYEVITPFVPISNQLKGLPGFRSDQNDVIDIRNKMIYDRSVSRRSAHRRKSLRFSESESEIRSKPTTSLSSNMQQGSWPSVRQKNSIYTKNQPHTITKNILKPNTNKVLFNNFSLNEPNGAGNNSLTPNEKYQSVLTPIPSFNNSTPTS